ncbi:hypothetical protein LEP1GSC127_3576 [Leptospira kirschneri str. 200801925]|nr:hypothetical protein LEP1GSC127_3576 [Leptospira kirschneri str. 200801925]
MQRWLNSSLEKIYVSSDSRRRKKRQIRRMFHWLGANVVDLQRIRIGRLELEKFNLEEGQYLLTETGIWK